MVLSRIHFAFLGVICLLSFCGCFVVPHPIDVGAIGPANEVIVHDHGSIVSEYKVAADSSEEREIAAWFQAHNTGWKTTVVTEAPGTVFRGNDFDLNVVNDDFCVLNYRTRPFGVWTEVCRTLDPGDKPPSVVLPPR